MSQKIKSLRKEREAIRESMRRMEGHFGDAAFYNAGYMELKQREDEITKQIAKIVGGK